MPSCTPDFAGGPDLSDTLGITLLLAFFALLLGGTRADAANSVVMQSDASGMNVLMVIIEDCNAGVWGSYGNPICRTPNMDRFARTAVQFESAYVQATACNPSRSSFLTGLRPLTTRVWANSQVMRDQIPSGTLTLPQMLKNHGLHTAVIGKFFHRHEFGGPLMLAFDRIEHAARPTGWKGPPPILNLPPVPVPVVEAPPPNEKSPEYRAWKNRRSSRYGVSGVKLEHEGDYRISQIAVALLGEFAKTRQRFFLSVHQARPHTPLLAPKKYIDLYDPESIPLPPAQAPSFNLKEFPYAERSKGGNPDLFGEGQPSIEEARKAIAAYYACVSFVDDNIGRILDALEKQGLADNTVVVIMGDHGFHLGDHGMWSKYSMLEATRRAPLWIRVPGAAGNGRVCREFVEFVDLIPTLGELLDFPVPSNLEGVSFAPLLSKPDRPWKSAVFQVQSPDEQMVRNRRFSYMEFGKGPVPVALYDLQLDPWETRNLANDPAYARTRSEMAALLKSGWRSALPPVAN